MRHLRLTLQYDGTAYQGWQRQRRGPSIQATLEEALGRLTQEQVRLLSAGRTDSGVHALAQVASFRTSSALPCETVHRALNALLPGDIRVLEVREAPQDFHPRYSARGKRYFYLLSLAGEVPVFLRRYVWQLRRGLNVEAMKEAAQGLLGRHDFSAFRASGCCSRSTLRELRLLQIEPLWELCFATVRFEGRFLKITLEADAFLRHMARNIVGTLVEVGKGRMSPQDVASAMAKRDRTLAGPTAPAQGLFLEKVFY
jgi:tRNA pseudouridine38-40 synthase